ncbi:hypothetical protein JTB14_038265 [Gonioctena quinquepunctata]|nr:hypothetical protein JTB14_038265 [Gonioctena quinquepunctata]
MSTSQSNDKDAIEYKALETFTDEEFYETDNEMQQENIPEITVDLNAYNVDNIDEAESNKHASGLLTPSPRSILSDSNDSDTQHVNTQLLSTLSLSPNLSDLTDVEILLSDDGEAKPLKKGKSKRRRQEALANNQSQIQKKSQSELMIRSQSLAYESDNEDEYRLQFPVCKKIAEKKHSILNIPEFDTNFPTDTEDLEDLSESVTSPTSQGGDDLAFDEKLAEMAAGSSQTRKTQHQGFEREPESELKGCDSIDDHSNTDIDNYETDDSSAMKPAKTPSFDYDIKFSPTLKDNKRSPPSGLSVPVQSDEAVTDCENLDSSDDEDRREKMQFALLRSTDLTDEEELDGDPYSRADYPEIELPPPVRNMIILKDNESLPTVKILPIDDDSQWNSPNNEAEEVSTDEESISHIDDSIDRTVAVEFLFQDCGVIDESEEVRRKSKTRSDMADELTDTEELVMDTQKRRRAPKFKYMHEKFLSEKNKLAVKPSTDSRKLTDTEDVYLTDDNEETFRSLSPMLNLPDAIADGATDTEVIAQSSDEEIYTRPGSRTPQHMREMEGEMIMSKDGSGAFSPQERLLVNKNVKRPVDVIPSPMYTDTEDLATSADEDLTSYTRAETATPSQVQRALDQVSSSKVHTEDKRKFDAEGCMYLKGGGYVEHPTDVEDLSEEECVVREVIIPDSGVWAVDLGEKKISLDFRNGSASFGACEEWEATRKPVDSEPKAPPIEKDAAQKDLSSPGTQFISYESVLLNANRSVSPTSSPPKFLHRTTSYTQIDAMLEKMLFEVEKQEKLFGLDLDVLEPEEKCFNSLELHPSTDALIEVPIKKTIRKPKVYETTRELMITQEECPFDLITFTGKPQKELPHEYDLISFQESDKSKELDEITQNMDDLVKAVEADESMLFTDKPENEYLERPYNFKIDLEKAATASSESLSDHYPDSWNDEQEQGTVDDDYEFIENKPLTHVVQLHDHKTGNDIWWEGTYRNLSIVPEEDEENVSLLGSCYSSKTYNATPYTPLIDSQGNGLTSSKRMSSGQSSSFENDYSSDESSSGLTTSSDEGTYETGEKVVKAEVKLMVKTSDRGKEAIEIRSVREFMDISGRSNVPSADSLPKNKLKERSQTLPGRLSEKINNITNKFSGLLEKKKASSYFQLPVDETDTGNKQKEGDKNKPTYTLQRVFVRNPESDFLVKGAAAKDAPKIKTELLATSSNHFPLDFDPNKQTESDTHKVDLFANIPFYPCYSQYSTTPKSPATLFISSPFSDNSQIPQAYCDWLPEKGDNPGGKTTVFQTEEKQFYPNLTDQTFVNRKIMYDQTNALIQSESRAEPYHCHTDKHYKVEKRDFEKEESQSVPAKEKKRKKSILGTIKNFVGKSFESDSESEKSSPKKKKRDKKKPKAPEGELPPEAPARTFRKPKLPTPTEDRKYADIPFFESSASDEYRTTHIETIERTPVQGTYISSITIPITDLDEPESEIPTEIRDKAEEIVTDVISDSEKAAEEKLTTKSRKQKVVILNQEITKTFIPRAVDEEEFTIVIDPTRKETPKKTRETFTLNIDESIEKLVKPVAQFDERPVRPPRFKSHIYEDIDEPQLSPPDDHLVTEPERWQVPSDIKTVTNQLIQNEISYLGWADDEHNVFNREKSQYDGEKSMKEDKEGVAEQHSQKNKKKHGKLFGIFSKSVKDTYDSEDETRREKGKSEVKPTFSETTIKSMIDSTAFLKEEVDKYHDVKPHVYTSGNEITETATVIQSYDFSMKGGKPVEIVTKNGTISKNITDEEISDVDIKPFVSIGENTSHFEIASEPNQTQLMISNDTIRDMNDSEIFLKDEISRFHDVRPIVINEVKDSLQNKRESVTGDANKQESPKQSKKKEADGKKSTFFGVFNKKGSEEKEIIKSKPPIASEELSIGDITKRKEEESESFLKDEIEKYHDVRQIITKSPVDVQEKVVIAKVIEDESPKNLKKEADEKKSSLFGVFKKKGSEGKEMKSEQPKASIIIKSPVDVEEKVVIAKVREDESPKKLKKDADEKKSTLFGVFKKKGSEEKEMKSEPPKASVVLPTGHITKKNMEDSDTFLKDEIEKYHDVRQIITKSPVDVEEKVVIAKVREDESPKKLKKDADEKKSTLFGVFKKKGSEEKEMKSEQPKASVVLPTGHITKKNMEDSDTFLKDEIEKYHDVPKVRKDESPKKLKKDADEKKSTLFGVFKKKGSEEKEMKSEPPKASVVLPTGHITKKNMEESDTFLKDEIEKYHDVLITKSSVDVEEKVVIAKVREDESPKKLKKEADEKKGTLFGVFKKKGSEEKEMKSEPPKASMVFPTGHKTKQNMEESNTFLKDEIEKYHDVRP